MPVYEIVPKIIRANRLRDRIEAVEKKTKEWVEAVCDLAVEFYEARSEFDSNKAFGHWLEDNDLNRFSDQDRWALINMGEHIELTTKILPIAKYQNYRLIWENDIRPCLCIDTKTTAIETKTENSTETPVKTEQIEEAAPQKSEKSYRSKLNRLPKSELVLQHIINPTMRSRLAQWTNLRKCALWDLLLESIECGTFGDPVNRDYASKCNLRVLLPWAPPNFANGFDLKKAKYQEQIRNEIFPFILEHREKLRTNPEKLPELIQAKRREQQDRIRNEQQENRRQKAIANMPEEQEKIIIFGEPTWPPVDNDPFTYDELRYAIWFFDFVHRQLKTEWDAQSKGLQIQQMLKWITPICSEKYPNWATAVRHICFWYQKNPNGEFTIPRRPANFGIG